VATAHIHTPHTARADTLAINGSHARTPSVPIYFAVPQPFNFSVKKEWKRKILLESGRKWHARSDLVPPNLAQQHKQAHVYSQVGTLAVFKPHLYID
jgi:hypothetical protein